MNLQQWTDLVRDELDIDVAPDLRTILDLARDVAHSVERPAAPVTAFLVGYAAAARGGATGDIDAVTNAVRARIPTDTQQ